MTQNKQTFRFKVSIHYELFFALQALTDPDSRIHPGWKRGALAILPDRFHRRFAAIGASPFVWPCIADTIQNEPACADFDGLVLEMQRAPVHEFQQTILQGVLHFPTVVSEMLAGGRSLRDAIAGVPKAKREWLAFIGLYPYQPHSPLVEALESLLRSPVDFRNEILFLVKTFWESSFQSTWLQLQPQLNQSMEEKERLFQSCSFEEFARLALLRVEVDESRGLLKAVRGGFRMALKDIAAAYFFPSCFNDKRHWTCYPAKQNKQIVCFPYFDPAISLDFAGQILQSDLAEPELDPALIFAAMGDSTRYAMVSLMARSPASSAELSRSLALSRPTVSHHIHVLREAGLLSETPEGNAVRLSLRRDVLEELSGLVVRKLFDSTGKIEIKKTRKQ